MASVRLDHVDKVYPNGHVAAHDLCLEVADGEFLVLVGPSGCGKSTALRTVAGLEAPTSGRVRIGERDVTDLPPQERDVAMVFQNYALYPHMTVRENLSFGLRMRGVEPAERERRVREAAAALGLAELLDRKPGQLSGGQRQRVALGRATVRDPAAFLFDEPLSNLDARLRVETRAELALLHRRLGATMIYVTHDQEEAMTLGQRVAVMQEGRLEQVAPPMEVYGRPASIFVAGFVGSPAMNLFRGELEREGGVLRFRGPGWGLPLEDAALPSTDMPSGRAVVLGVRPDETGVLDPDAEERHLVCRVEVVEPLGARVLLHLRPERGEGGNGEIRVMVAPEESPTVEERVGLRFRRDRLHLFDAASGRRLGAAAAR